MTSKPWVANGPEDRLSIAVDRFLDRTLIRPAWASAIHDKDGGARSMQQRIRDENRGIRKGAMDWDVVQGPPYLHRKLELKRGKNGLSPHQMQTVKALAACGGQPIVAWSLLEVYDGLVEAGFRFTPNVRTVLAEMQAHLDAWDREAELIKSGAVVRKTSKKRPEPRYVLGKAAVSRARRAGIMT